MAAAIAGHVRAVDRVLKIMQRRAALLGLDAPQKRELSGGSSRAGAPPRADGSRHHEAPPALDFSRLSAQEQRELERLLDKLVVDADAAD